MTDTPARAHNFKVGDTVTVIHKGIRKDGKIKGIALSGGINKWRIGFGAEKWHDILLKKGKEAKRLYPNPGWIDNTTTASDTPARKWTNRNEKTSSRTKSTDDVPEQSAEKPEQSDIKPTSRVNLTRALRQILIDDQTMMSRFFLVTLPAKQTVNDVIADFIKVYDNSFNNFGTSENDDKKSQEEDDTCLLLITRQLVNHFNDILGSELLYDFERCQFDDLIVEENAITKDGRMTKEGENFRASSRYGIVHFLRMLSRLHDDFTIWSSETVKKRFFSAAANLVEFLDKNYDKYHHQGDDYESATLAYYRRTLALEKRMSKKERKQMSDEANSNQPSTSAQ